MPRGPRSIRNNQYSAGGGGGGGGFGTKLAAILGTEPMIQGGDVTNQIDPEIDLGTSGTPVMEPYTVSKPNFFSKLNGGNQRYADLNNSLKFADMQNLQAKDLAAAHGQAQLSLEKLRSSNDITEKQSAAELKAQEDRALEEAALNKLAAEQGFGSWAGYKEILDDPDMRAAGVNKMYNERKKIGFDNAATQAKTRETLEADIPYKQAQAAQALSTATRNKFFTLDKSQALVQPGSPESIVNADPSQYGNYPSGGPVALGGGNGGFDVTESGKLVRPVRKGIPQMLARPVGQQTPALPQFEFPKPPAPSLNLPPGYEPYRGFIEQQQQSQAPVTEQPEQQSPRIFPLDANSQQPQNYTNPLLQFLQKKRIGMPQQFNPYNSGY